MEAVTSFFGFGPAPAQAPKKNGATAPRMNGNGPNLEMGPVEVVTKGGKRRHQSRKQNKKQKQRQSRKH